MSKAMQLKYQAKKHCHKKSSARSSRLAEPRVGTFIGADFNFKIQGYACS